MGDTRTQLILSSPIGGEYICPLFGHCIAPRPQGPFVIKPGAPAIVNFKNVFATSTIYNFFIDNPAFVVKPTETIPGKKSIQVSISFKPPGVADSGKGDKAAAAATAATNQFLSTGTRVGKLTITTPISSVVWVYYLKLSP